MFDFKPRFAAAAKRGFFLAIFQKIFILRIMVNRMRSNHSHTGNRRSHHALLNPAMSKDGSTVHLRHRANPITGKYRGHDVIDVAKKITRMEKKAKSAKAAK